jgi:hypothetical protein
MQTNKQNNPMLNKVSSLTPPSSYPKFQDRDIQSYTACRSPEAEQVLNMAKPQPSQKKTRHFPIICASAARICP